MNYIRVIDNSFIYYFKSDGVLRKEMRFFHFYQPLVIISIIALIYRTKLNFGQMRSN